MTLSAKSSLTSPVDDVLQDYLNDLLISATELSAAPVAHPPAATVTERPVPLTRQAHSEPSVAASTKPVALREPLPTLLPVDMPVAPVRVEPDIQAPDVLENSVPEFVLESNPLSEVELAAIESEQARLNWQSSAGVECLIFKVAGLKLALPLPMLGGVFNANDDVTPLFGQAKWSLGVWQSETDTLTIVDSAQLIMPERGTLLADQGYRYIIQLDRSPWALACQEICDTMTLKHDSIKWRGEGSKRPWLAGTVISEMCALIDVPGMLRMLEQHRRIKR